MTGRGAGYCAGFDAPGYDQSIQGQRRGMAFGGAGRGGRFGGFGRRGGWRNMFHATNLPGWMRFGWRGGSVGSPARDIDPDPTDEMRLLRNQMQRMQQELDGARQRLKELEGSPTPKEGASG
jgi:hypothetical protein